MSDVKRYTYTDDGDGYCVVIRDEKNTSPKIPQFTEFVLASDYDAYKDAAGIEIDHCHKEIAALTARVAELEKEVAVYKPVWLTEQLRRGAHLGSAMVAHCGCHSWTNGLGQGGEYKCSAHADGEKQV